LATPRLVSARLLSGQVIDRTGAGVLVCGDDQRRSDERVIDVLKKLVELGFLKHLIELGRTEAGSPAELERWWERITELIENALYDDQSLTVQTPTGISWFHDAQVDISHEFDRGQQWLRLTIPRGLSDESWAQAVASLPGVLDLTGVPDVGEIRPDPCVDLESPLEIPPNHRGKFVIETGQLAETVSVPVDLLRAHLLRSSAHGPSAPSYQPVHRGYGGVADLYVGLTGGPDAGQPRAARRGIVVPVIIPLDVPPTITWRLRRPPGVIWSPGDRVAALHAASKLNYLLAA
jgi:hypothetical protein